MNLESLAIENFRLLRRVKVELAEGANLFIGENAQGKTTILEAVSCLARGRSFRTTRDREMIARNTEGVTSAEGRWSARGTRHAVRVAITPQGKSFWLDGKPMRRLGDLWGRVNVVTFVPEDLELVRGGPAERRALVDSLLAQSSAHNLATMQRYKTALGHRNAMLRSGNSGGAQFDAYEAQMADYGAQFLAARDALLSDFIPVAMEQLIKLTGGSEEFVLRHEAGWPASAKFYDAASADKPPDAEQLARWWRDNRAADGDRGFTQHGPHRADIALMLDGQDARSFASQGQTRTIALSLRLAERAMIEKLSGEPPVLLLDDVLGELDKRRSQLFVRLLSQPGVQSLLTATDAAALESELPIAARFNVRAGEVSPIRPQRP
ncbi:DNA replication/repair protein RecF [soil metagenome]